MTTAVTKLVVYSKRNWKRKRVWRWRLTGENYKVIAASSESFASKQNCLKNLELTKHYLALLEPYVDG